MAKTLVYQLSPITWEEQGGLKAMMRHLDVASDLGADYVWLSPIYPSPRKDRGYDIADFTAVDLRLGTMADFDAFVKKAHSFGIGVVMDLVINHTSVDHVWFKDHPEYYCWTELNYLHRWTNLLDGSEYTWEYDKSQQEYYLHLYHESEADLNWFPWRERINKELVREYRQIVKFWTEKHEVDGFHLTKVQATNKDLRWPELERDNLLFGSRAREIIKAVFYDANDLFIMMDCMDPTYGGLTEFYTEGTQVDFVTNSLLKEAHAEGQDEFEKIINSACKDPRYMLEFESEYVSRFPARNYQPEWAIWTLFTSEAEGVCLFQGEELGLISPPNQPIKQSEYEWQSKNPSSYYNLTKKWIDYWKSH